MHARRAVRAVLCGRSSLACTFCHAMAASVWRVSVVHYPAFRFEVACRATKAAERVCACERAEPLAGACILVIWAVARPTQFIQWNMHAWLKAGCWACLLLLALLRMLCVLCLLCGVRVLLWLRPIIIGRERVPVTLSLALWLALPAIPGVAWLVVAALLLLWLCFAFACATLALGVVPSRPGVRRGGLLLVHGACIPIIERLLLLWLYLLCLLLLGLVLTSCAKDSACHAVTRSQVLAVLARRQIGHMQRRGLTWPVCLRLARGPAAKCLHAFACLTETDACCAVPEVQCPGEDPSARCVAGAV